MDCLRISYRFLNSKTLWMRWSWKDAATLWTVSGPEDAPKDVDGWTKLDHAAVAMIETMKFLQKSNLTKDQGEWLNKSNMVIDVSNKARSSNQGKECR